MSRKENGAGTWLVVHLSTLKPTALSSRPRRQLRHSTEPTNPAVLDHTPRSEGLFPIGSDLDLCATQLAVPRPARSFSVHMSDVLDWRGGTGEAAALRVAL
jgi:hypothetical protein